jgi:hypothetical protein
MIRRVAAVILALTINPAMLRAQDAVLTVSVASADVYKGPSNVTPVVGHAPRGAVLPISRNLGSWVKVAWPEAPDGVGYVHVTMGRVGAPGPNTPAAAAARSSAAPAPTTTTLQPMQRTSVGEQVVTRRQLNMTPANHILGIGGTMGSMSSFGGSARVWGNNRVGVQFGVRRDAMTSPSADGRVTTMQFEPGVVFGLMDHVSDYVWLRPYIGSAMSLRRETLSTAAPAALAPAPETGLGFSVFGGTELMFASLPKFGLSADAGYRRYPTPFAGFEADRIGLSIAGHWYIR